MATKFRPMLDTLPRYCIPSLPWKRFLYSKGTITKFKFGLHCHFKYYLEFKSGANSLVLWLSLVWFLLGGDGELFCYSKSLFQLQGYQDFYEVHLKCVNLQINDHLNLTLFISRAKQWQNDKSTDWSERGFPFRWWPDNPPSPPAPARSLAKKDVTANPQWKPEFSPLTSNVQKGNQLPTEQSHTLNQSYFESVLRLRLK